MAHLVSAVFHLYHLGIDLPGDSIRHREYAAFSHGKSAVFHRWRHSVCLAYSAGDTAPRKFTGALRSSLVFSC